jgi:flagellar basal body-associated protein FliL
MSEEAKETIEAPDVKKKGKLPVVLMLLVLIGGGGFFGMKMRAGGPKKVVIKAGSVEPIDKEFLVNLKGGPNLYLRAEIAVELREGAKKEDLDANMPAIRDSINQIFRSKALPDVAASQTSAIQKEIGDAVNSILISHMKDEEKKAQAGFERAAAQAHPAEKKAPEGETNNPQEKKEEWVCPAGPVLNVYFTSFTTQ